MKDPQSFGFTGSKVGIGYGFRDTSTDRVGVSYSDAVTRHPEEILVAWRDPHWMLSGVFETDRVKPIGLRTVQ